MSKDVQNLSMSFEEQHAPTDLLKVLCRSHAQNQTFQIAPAPLFDCDAPAFGSD
ncbi:hypothetical protein D3C72_1438460 [compost metagenome]